MDLVLAWESDLVEGVLAGSVPQLCASVLGRAAVAEETGGMVTGLDPPGWAFVEHVAAPRVAAADDRWQRPLDFRFWTWFVDTKFGCSRNYPRNVSELQKDPE